MGDNNNIASYLEEYYWYWFCNIPGVGMVKLRRLLALFETPMQVYKAKKQLLQSVGILTDREIENIMESKKDGQVYEQFCDIGRKGIHFTHPGKEDYPQRLMNIYDYPLCLYYYGSLPGDDRPTVAIVGSRQNTTYGYNVANTFAASFAGMGIQVISGLARGIDGASHVGALKAGGYTCGVLGCGVDICYPRDNIELFTRMKQQGGVVSEYSIGTPPHPGQFPVRNRIISGLSDVVIVVEARKKSGSLITVDSALEQNKEVMVVPGRIGDSLSEGCNGLIKQGASIITCPEDILEIECVRSRIINTDDSLSKNNRYSNNTYSDNTYSDNRCINKSETDLSSKSIDKKVTVKGSKNVLEGNSSIPEYLNNKDSVPEFELATKKNMLYSCVDLYPVGINELMDKTGLSLQDISSALVELELEGKIEEVANNCYSRIYK